MSDDTTPHHRGGRGKKQIRVVPGTESYDLGSWVDVPDDCIVDGRWDDIVKSVSQYIPEGYRAVAARLF